MHKSQNIFLAFLGKGDYQEAIYELNGRKASATRYVQRAELELLGPSKFTKIILALTPSAKEKHYKNLSHELFDLGVDEKTIRLVTISEELDPTYHWQWFESILKEIGYSDHLYVDLTHGYRIVPIVISTAIRYLQQTRNIVLKAVYYGAYERDTSCSPIIDCKDFYVINEWAEGVNRLVEDADASKIIELCRNGEKLSDTFSSLSQNDFSNALIDLTTSLKRVEIDQIPLKAHKAIGQLENLLDDMPRDTEKELLYLITKKYKPIAASKTHERYDSDYFRCQLAIARLYLEHCFFMQGLTTMRELMVSWLDKLVLEQMEILFQSDWSDFDNKKKKKYRRESRLRFAEHFLGAFIHPIDKWVFKTKFDPAGTRCELLLKPIYKQIEEKGLLSPIELIIKPLIKLRNGFDHAWTGSRKAEKNLEETAFLLLNKLQDFFRQAGIVTK